VKFVKQEGGWKLLVGFHEWAGSLRTTGMPVWALFKNGKAVQIGTTGKAPEEYAVPEGAIAIIRRYASNSGILTYYVYVVPDGTVYYVEEQFNFSLSELPDELQKPVREFLEKTERLPIF
jgi:hypothetical protein